MARACCPTDSLVCAIYAEQVLTWTWNQAIVMNLLIEKKGFGLLTEGVSFTVENAYV